MYWRILSLKSRLMKTFEYVLITLGKSFLCHQWRFTMPAGVLSLRLGGGALLFL